MPIRRQLSRPLLLLLALTALLGLAACPRVSEEYNYHGANATATYPWELAPQSAEDPEAGAEQARADAEAAAAETEVPIPAGVRWPSLSKQDTLDEQTLYGVWQHVCSMSNERINIFVPEQLDYLDLRPDSTFTMTFSPLVPERGGPIRGNWSISGPGQITLAVGDSSPMMHAELFRENFLFFWDPDNRLSYWYVRVPESATPQIQGSTWNTSLGELRIGNVIQGGFEFEVTGSSTRSGTGFYENGIMRVRWEDPQNNAGGFGAFRVSPDWKSLEGVWWIDDYEAAPFGGAWDSLPDSSGA